MVWDGTAEPAEPAEAPAGGARLAPDFERTPPYDLLAEQRSLGGMLQSREAVAEVITAMRPHDHYRGPHETIHLAILDLYTLGEPVDVISVGNYLRKAGSLDRVGGPGYLHDLYDMAPSGENADYYAEIVHEKAVLRRLTEAGGRIRAMGFAGEGDLSEIVTAAHAELSTVEDARGEEQATPLADSMEGTVAYLEELENRGSGPAGIPTGFADLDALTNGLQAGQMIVIAARPAMGKSTLALDIARAASIHHGIPGAFFSLEMGRSEIDMRILSAEARVGLHLMRSGRMKEDDWTRIARRLPDITNAPLYIDDSPNLSMAEIRTKARRLADKKGIKFLAIDYLQLMQAGALGGGRRSENRQTEVSDMSRNLKLLAKELGIPVIALSQLNRGPEQRVDKKPMVSDLRESGSIEQDADMVILLHREDAYDKDSARAGEADLIVAKHRNGPTCTITVAFQGHYSRFVDMARDAT
jgi:replicative DNA helicase